MCVGGGGGGGGEGGGLLCHYQRRGVMYNLYTVGEWRQEQKNFAPVV